MSDTEADAVVEALQTVLAQHPEVVAHVEDDDGYMDEMVQPVVTEWVLIANCVDLAGDARDGRITVVTAPHMLRSHVLGLLTMATDL